MSDDINRVRELAEQLLNARASKKEYEDKLKEINKDIKNIEEKELAGLLDELCVSKLSVADMDITKSVVFRPGYVKHSDPEAFQFLFDTNNDGALKKHLVINLESYPDIPTFLDLKGVDYKIEYSIHHATLGSIIKELVEAGKFGIDDILKYDVYVQPQVKIKTTK